MYDIAHYKLIQMIEYKALKYGIVVINVEESYTSKTSFIDNNKLLSYTDKKFNVNNVLQNTVNANPEKPKTVGFGGIRKDRVFINQQNCVLIHSDVNGAFNIIRKVFTDFKYEKSINTAHHIVTIASNKKKFQYIT